MKELNDTDFDQVFKTRITEELPAFEEESWLKMEQKLRKKDRLVFYRNASIILLFLSFGLGFYFTTKTGKNKSGETIALENKHKTNPNDVVTKAVAINPNQGITPGVVAVIDPADVIKNEHQKINQQLLNSKIAQTVTPILTKELVGSQNVKNNDNKVIESLTAQQPLPSVLPIEQSIANTGNTTSGTAAQQQNIATVQVPIEAIVSVSDQADLITNEPQKKPVPAKVKRKIPISLAISAGPDFNSTSSLIGGKTSVAIGLSVGVGLTKKLSIHTGLGFGMKNYSGGAADYNFTNTKAITTYNPYAPSVQATITEIAAACKVLEVPLLASFLLTNDQKRSISLNAGLSSYFMLKEEYTYKYTAASGKQDRINDFSNANQHILSVVNLSATYNLKLKNKKFGFGIEPYVKIPLTGIGEGSVPLKSSGISLKLQYDFNKN